MNIKNKNEAITLIGLVVTIVLIIILAGVTFNILLGPNGVFDKVKEAKLKNKIAQITEQLELQKGPVQVEKYGAVNLEDYMAQILKEGIISNEDIRETGDENSRIIVVDGEFVYLIKQVDDEDVEIIYYGQLDNLLPIFEVEVADITSSSIKVNITAERMENGRYYFYIKDVESGEEYQLKESNTVGEYTFKNLIQKKEYKIMVKAQNITGIVSKETNMIKTLDIDDSTTSNISFNFEPKGWTNGDVVVTATTPQNMPSGWSLQTSKDLIQWDDTDSQTFSENGTMYAHIWDGTNAGNYVFADVEKIDKTNPLNATITLDKTTATTIDTINGTITQEDAESGVNIEKCKWTYTTSTTPLGTNPSDYPNEFSSENSTNISIKISTAGTYFLHVLTVNNAGGKTETIYNTAINITEPRFTVSFDSNGGNAVSSQTVIYQSTYGTLPTPTRTGYTFAGWYTSESNNNGTGTKIESTTVVSQKSNHTLYARWNVNTYSVSYELKGGKNNSNNVSKATYGSTISLSNPTRSTCTFNGWYTDSGLTNKVTSITISGNTTLYAKWSHSSSCYGKVTQYHSVTYSGGRTGSNYNMPGGCPSRGHTNCSVADYDRTYYYYCGSTKKILGHYCYTKCNDNGYVFDESGKKWSSVYPNGYPCSNHTALKCGY